MREILTIDEAKAAADPGSYCTKLREGSGIMKHYMTIDGVAVEGQSNYEKGESEVYGIQADYRNHAALVRALVRARDGVANSKPKQGDSK